MIRTLLTTFCFLIAPPMVSAADKTDQIESAWRGWMTDQGIKAGTIAIGFEGNLAREAGIGWPADQAAPIASLSKLITGLCILDLVDKGKLSLEATIGEVFPDYPTARGAEEMVLGDILTHSAGLGNDRTQKKMPLWLGDENPRHAEVAKHTIRKGPHQQIKGKYFYNNENYAIFGHVIETITSESYAAYCDREILKPAGVTTAKLSPVYGGFAAWGGWEMNASDFLNLANSRLALNTKLGGNPFAFPHRAIANGMFYGPGIVFRTFGGGHNFWHFGAYCIDRFQAGTFFVQWQNGYSVTVLTDRCFDDAKMISLDGALTKAAFH